MQRKSVLHKRNEVHTYCNGNFDVSKNRNFEENFILALTSIKKCDIKIPITEKL